MKLEDIGFYTLFDDRVKNLSPQSDLQRCELILTDRCNFNCAYCRGIKQYLQGDLTLSQAKKIVDLWTDNNLHNIGFSGGEPTIWPDLNELVKYTKMKESIQHIALSTNGSATLTFYKNLIKYGVNDFSISLDACCSSTAKVMAGKTIKFDYIANNIKELSKLTYVTVDVVLNENNIHELNDIILFCDSLGVSDIRLIPSAQYNQLNNINITEDILNKYPILKYRYNRLKNNLNVRGLSKKDSKKCSLVLDDMVILNNYHFPCDIYMREQGNPINKVNDKTISTLRQERNVWSNNHSCYEDAICKNQCLDFCIEYNNKVIENKLEKCKISPITINTESIREFLIKNLSLIPKKYKTLMIKGAIGYTKENNIFTVVFKTNSVKWKSQFQIDEFIDLFC